MKKINTYVLENTDFVHSMFVSVQWVVLMIVFALNKSNTIKSEWLDSAFVLTGIGYLSFIIIPFFIFQHKIIFRENSKKILHCIIIVLFYSQIIFIFQFLFIVVFSRNGPLFCFANTGVMFMFSCIKRILR